MHPDAFSGCQCMYGSWKIYQRVVGFVSKPVCYRWFCCFCQWHLYIYFLTWQQRQWCYFYMYWSGFKYSNSWAHQGPDLIMSGLIFRLHLLHSSDWVVSSQVQWKSFKLLSLEKKKKKTTKQNEKQVSNLFCALTCTLTCSLRNTSLEIADRQTRA